MEAVSRETVNKRTEVYKNYNLRLYENFQTNDY